MVGRSLGNAGARCPQRSGVSICQTGNSRSTFARCRADDVLSFTGCAISRVNSWSGRSNVTPGPVTVLPFVRRIALRRIAQKRAFRPLSCTSARPGRIWRDIGSPRPTDSSELRAIERGAAVLEPCDHPRWEADTLVFCTPSRATGSKQWAVESIDALRLEQAERGERRHRQGQQLSPRETIELDLARKPPRVRLPAPDHIYSPGLSRDNISFIL
jgi:hypothetical protein